MTPRLKKGSGCRGEESGGRRGGGEGGGRRVRWGRQQKSERLLCSSGGMWLKRRSDGEAKGRLHGGGGTPRSMSGGKVGQTRVLAARSRTSRMIMSKNNSVPVKGGMAGAGMRRWIGLAGRKGSGRRSIGGVRGGMTVTMGAGGGREMAGMCGTGPQNFRSKGGEMQGGTVQKVPVTGICGGLVGANEEWMKTGADWPAEMHGLHKGSTEPEDLLCTTAAVSSTLI
jgi:hypothetical protein